MKKFLIVFVIVMGLASFAQAFTVPDEVQVSPASAPVVKTKTPVKSAVEPKQDSQQKDESTAIERGFGRVIQSVKDMMKAGSTTTATEAGKAAKTAVETASTRMTDAANEAKIAAQGAQLETSNLKSALLGKTTKNGDFQKGVLELNANKTEKVIADQSLITMLVNAVVMLLVGVGIVVASRVGLKGIGEKIDANPEKTATMVKLQESFTLTGVGNRGINYRISPISQKGAVKTLQIVGGTGDAYYDIEDVPRIPAKSPGHIRSTNARVLEAYVNGEFDDENDKLQIAIIENAINESGEVEKL